MPKKEVKPKAASTAEVLVMLKAKYADGGYAVLTEVGDGTGSRTYRWCDALTMSIWPSRGLELTGFKIKVSRGDWQKELQNPAKAEAICKYCDRWWIVAGGEGIIHIDELPKTWGLMVVKGGKLHIGKPAPELTPVPLDRNFIAAIMRRAAEQSVDDATIKAAIAKERAAWEKYRKEQDDRDRLRSERHGDPLQVLTAKVRAFSEASGVNILDGWYGPRKIGEAVRVVLSNHGRTPGVGHLEHIRNLAKSIVTDIDTLEGKIGFETPEVKFGDDDEM